MSDVVRLDPQLTTLSNGVRVVTQSMPALETASVGVWVDAGARHESPRINGISHLIEHMAFKGTARRSAQAIAEEIEAVGGHLNAYTSREQTAYYAKVLKDDVPLAMDLLGDILLNAAFDPEELERERTVIIQEIGQVHDTPDDLVFDLFQEAAYPNQAMGRSVLGSVDRVSNMTRAELAGYLQHHYTPGRMIVAAAGAVDHEQILALAEAAFGALSGDDDRNVEAARYVGGDTRDARPLEQVHFLIGLDGVAYGDDDYYAAQIFSTVLGGGMSSRLFQEVRERRGLAYSVYAFTSSFTDGGLFGIYAGTSQTDSAELVDVLCAEAEKAVADLSPTEVQRARTQLKAGLLMSLESAFSRCEQMARQLLIFGRLIPTSEIIANIDAIDRADLTRVGERLFGCASPTVAALGPIADLPDYDWIQRRLG